ncbi:retinitis pigmentosa 1-like 1 protein [Camellia sinensis]|uniref:retinitis pigmentosa 1-like 1 protein n=1 Tax=Camellia sinensis TaxID=4442 RepID=UPI001035F38A|nr:retinitis pigmentosa 1-like 1 protein [Camellia sinensis]
MCGFSLKEKVLPQPPKGFCQSFFPSKDLKKLLDLPVHKRRALLVLNFIPTYKSVLPDVPKKKKKKSLSPPFATTPQAASSSQPDQAFENRKELTDKKREAASLQKTNKNLQSKIKTLEDQAEAAINAKDDAEEKAESTEAIKKILEAEKREAEEKITQAQKELQEALATKEAEVKAADEKGYNEGVADVTVDYEKQDEEGAEVPIDDAPQKAISDVPIADKILDQTLQEIDAELVAEKAAEDEEGAEVPIDDAPQKAISDVPIADKILDQTLQEIDAELVAEKAAEASSQQSYNLQIQPSVVAEES